MINLNYYSYYIDGNIHIWHNVEDDESIVDMVVDSSFRLWFLYEDFFSLQLT